MAYSRLNPVTSSGVITKTWADQVDSNFEAVKPRILQPVAVLYTGTYSVGGLGAMSAVYLGNASDLGIAYHSYLIPSDFSSIKKAVARVVSLQTGNVAYALFSNFAAPGERYDAHANTTSVVDHITALSSGIITEIDITTCFPSTGIVANQSMGIEFMRNGASTGDTVSQVALVGPLDIEYNV